MIKRFYLRDPAIVAMELLGSLLVRVYNCKRLSGIIVETEAYYGRWDPVSRAHKSLRGDLAKTLMAMLDVHWCMEFIGNGC